LQLIYSLSSQCFNNILLKKIQDTCIIFLVLKLHEPNGNLHLSRTKYIKDLLQRTNIIVSKPQPTPMIHTRWHCAMRDSSMYRSIVSSLQYILLTRPEFAFSVNKVCQFMHQPQQHQWKTIMHTMLSCRNLES